MEGQLTAVAPGHGGPESRSQSLRHLAALAQSGSSAESLWQEALRLACLDLCGDAGIAMSIQANERMQVAATFCWPTPVDQTPIPIAPDSQAAYVLARGAAVYTDLATETRFVPSRLVANAGFVSSLSTCVGVADDASRQPIGLIGVQFSQPQPTNHADELHLTALASVLALGLAHCSLTGSAAHHIDHDPLTGLLNRRGTFEMLDQIVAAHQRGCLMLIDLDGFKLVNDAHGHGAGDYVLQVVAKRLLAAVRPTDTVARLSGDEFIVIIHQAGLGRSLDIAERLIGQLEQTIAIPHATVSVSASVGVASIEHFSTVASLVHAADAAMYAAKAAGRGQVKTAVLSAASTTPIATKPGDEVTGAQFDLVDIDAAIGDLGIVFQPIIDIRTGVVTGIEALTRGPSGPLESPSVLFRIAETWGRLEQLESASKHLAFAAAVPSELTLYVNVDPAAFTAPGFVDDLLASWASHTVPNRRLVIELTERHLNAQPGRLLQVIERCRAMGWGIALDDVGVRAESLTVLPLVLPDVVKLDMSLINTNNRSHLAATAVALASYCERWPVQVIAEGIERTEDITTAVRLGATHMQGFLFGQPGPSPVFANVSVDLPDNAHLPSEPGGMRRTNRQQLMAISHHIESLATQSDCVVLAAVQRLDRYTDQVRAQYAALARRCGTVGVVGADIPSGMRSGVHHGSLGDNSDLTDAWEVLLLQPSGAIALLATQVGTFDDNTFDFRITTDRVTVESHARRILRAL